MDRWMLISCSLATVKWDETWKVGKAWTPSGWCGSTFITCNNTENPLHTSFAVWTQLVLVLWFPFGVETRGTENEAMHCMEGNVTADLPWGPMFSPQWEEGFVWVTRSFCPATVRDHSSRVHWKFTQLPRNLGHLFPNLWIQKLRVNYSTRKTKKLSSSLHLGLLDN